jgi:hypothetical protein
VVRLQRLMNPLPVLGPSGELPSPIASSSLGPVLRSRHSVAPAKCELPSQTNLCTVIPALESSAEPPSFVASSLGPVLRSRHSVAPAKCELPNQTNFCPVIPVIKSVLSRHSVTPAKCEPPTGCSVISSEPKSTQQNDLLNCSVVLKNCEPSIFINSKPKTGILLRNKKIVEFIDDDDDL